MFVFDLSHISTLQVIVVALALTVVDFVGAVLPALIATLTHTTDPDGHGFDAALIAQFLDTHILKRVFPIFGLLVISTSLGDASPEAGQAVFALAIAGLVAYLAETIKSVAANLPSSSTRATG